MMKRLWLCAAAAAALTASSAATPSFAADAAPAADVAKAQHFGAWGFDLSGQDKTVAPGQDFYKFASGGWEAKTQIPSDRTRWGAFDELRELSDARARAVIDRAAANKAATGEEAKIGALYNAFMNEALIEKLDAAPLAPALAEIKAATTREQLAAIMGRAMYDYSSSFFGSAIQQDAKNPSRYALYVGQDGLGLPDRDYYLTDQFKTQKAKYEAYVAQMLGMAGWPDAQAKAQAIVALETRIAEASWSKVEQRDPVKTYNPTTVEQLAKDAPSFPWRTYFKAAGVSDVETVIVGEKSAFPKIAAIFADTPIDVLQAWQAFHVVDAASPYLSKRFVDARFDFRGKVLSGQPENRPRWKRAVTTVGSSLGEAVGKLYVAAYFPPESKAAMEQLVGNLRAALKVRIEKLDWMGPDTKAKALNKLAHFNVKIGYPDHWRDYSGLEIKADDLYGDIRRSSAFEWNFWVEKLRGPVDRSLWGMTPQTVNAYYDPTMNEIVFPAAILQPPFFDPKADPAVNYGGIGAVIGHEISHGFDDQGRQFDADGTLRDWWTAQDADKFVVQTKRLSGQYSAFSPLPGAHVNGDLTMGENIGDLGGVLTALDAYHMSLGGKPAAKIDGLTGDQRFFLGFAQIWRGKIRDDALRQQLVTDPHSPSYYRANGTVRNVDAWYEAFGVKAGDPLYVAPDQRVRIW